MHCVVFTFSGFYWLPTICLSDQSCLGDDENTWTYLYKQPVTVCRTASIYTNILKSIKCSVYGVQTRVDVTLFRVVFESWISFGQIIGPENPNICIQYPSYLGSSFTSGSTWPIWHGVSACEIRNHSGI